MLREGMTLALGLELSGALAATGCFDMYLSPKSCTQRLLHSHSRIHFVLLTSCEERHSISRTQKETPIRTKERPGYIGLSPLHECLALPEQGTSTSRDGPNILTGEWRPKPVPECSLGPGPECSLGPDDAPGCWS